MGLRVCEDVCRKPRDVDRKAQTVSRTLLVSRAKEVVLLPIVRAMAWLACKTGVEEVAESAGSDYIALAWYWRIDRRRACELMDAWYPESS